jgi:uncharacterized protein (TIGR02598 family)
MRTRRLAFRDDAFRSGRGGDTAPRRYVISGTDSPLPCQGRGQGEGFAVCAASVGEPLTSILSPSARGEAENAAVTLNRYARRPSHRCDSRAAAFSLLEVVLALGVAAFCLIAVLGLLPVGVQTNRNASSQTAVSNIIATVVSDLRTTPAAATTSPEFAITFDAERTLFFDASGKASPSLSADSRYRLNVTWNSAPTGLHYAVLKATWPAEVDPATTPPGGSVEIFAAFDRN